MQRSLGDAPGARAKAGQATCGAFQERESESFLGVREEEDGLVSRPRNVDAWARADEPGIQSERGRA
jgi:hypothetical protein